MATPAPDAAAIIAALDGRRRRIQRALLATSAVGMLVLAVAALAVAWFFEPTLERWPQPLVFALSSLALLALRAGRADLAFAGVASATATLVTRVYLTQADATSLPFYLLLVLVLATLTLGARRLAGAVVALVTLTLGLRVGRLWVGLEVELGSWMATTLDVLGILIVGGGLLVLLRQRVGTDNAALNDALLGLDASLTRNRDLLARAERSADAARRADQAKSEFLARISHELRTPLNAILGYADILDEESQVAPDGRDDLARIRSAGLNLLGLVDRVLDLSQVEAGISALRESPTDLTELLDEVAALVQPLADRNHTALTTDVDPDLVVLVDRGRLRQVLVNLVGNATKFTTAGTVEVAAHVVGGELTIEVRDTGIGIAPDRIAHVFEPFAQGSLDVGGRFGGAGLGLTLCDRIVRHLGGRIAVVSELGRGSTFTVVLPHRAGRRLRAVS